MLRIGWVFYRRTDALPSTRKGRRQIRQPAFPCVHSLPASRRLLLLSRCRTACCPSTCWLLRVFFHRVRFFAGVRVASHELADLLWKAAFAGRCRAPHYPAGLGRLRLLLYAERRCTGSSARRLDPPHHVNEAWTWRARRDQNWGEHVKNRSFQPAGAPQERRR